MNVRDPKDTPAAYDAAENANVAKPDPIESGCANIAILLRLAGKSDLPSTNDLQDALLQDINLVREAIYLLTATSDQPAHFTLGQLISQPAIDAFRDENSHPLPGAEPKSDGVQARLVEIPYDDPTCTPDARYLFIRQILIPQAIKRVSDVLHGVFPPDVYTRLGHDHCALLSELNHRLGDSKLSHYACQAPISQGFVPAPVAVGIGNFNGSPCFAGEVPGEPIAPPYYID